MEDSLTSDIARTPPYPPSPVIKRIVWDPPGSIERRVLGPFKGKGKDGSDNWPLTWADDDNLYTTYGDGFGFDPIIEYKLGLGVAVVEGSATSFVGRNIRSDIENTGFGEHGRKGHGLLCVDGVLYLWLFHGDEEGGASQIAVSADKGVHWELADWRYDAFGLTGFVNYGRDYAGARDGYVYCYAHDGPMGRLPADQFILMRVAKERIIERAAYEFYVGLDAAGTPIWSPDIAQRGPVFEHADACGRSAMTYCAPLGRYLWWQAIARSDEFYDRGDTRFQGGFGIYDAPEPWGPWTTAYFTYAWDVGPGEHGDFPAKWMSADGSEVFLVFSGDDNFCIRRATFELR
jgi:hypothetical protein